MKPARGDLDAYRWQPYKDTIPFEGIDLTAATFEMQLRRWRDASGSPLVSLTTTASPDQGISVSVETVDGLPVSTVEIRIDETEIEGLPFTSPRGGDLALAYDLVITLPVYGKRRWLEGVFYIHAGATQ